MKHYDVVIIGAGTSGLTARREVAKKTNNYIVVDDGPMGTTCARVGCMPSKALIQIANDYHQSLKLSDTGIKNTTQLQVNSKEVMLHVRKLRDRFVRAVKNPMKDWEDKLITKRAKIVGPNKIQIGSETVKANKIIIATGSSPVIPKEWKDYSDYYVTTDYFFEMSELPKSMAVVGLGVIGLEIGQALSRLGVKVIGITKGEYIGGVTDPEIKDYVNKKIQDEFPVHFNGLDILERQTDNKLKIKADDQIYEVDKVLLAVGRSPNIKNLGLETLKIPLNDKGIPEVDRNTLKLVEAPYIFLPGDANADRPLLHEAADEGLIAGHNAVNTEQCFKRRTYLGITFSDPNIASIGKRYIDLKNENINFVTGEVSFEGQGRSIVKLKEQGLLHIYVDSQNHKILGAELYAPDGEHLAHLLAWSISLDLTVEEALKLPFYHPVVEEGLRTALREAYKKLETNHALELFRCTDAPIR